MITTAPQKNSETRPSVISVAVVEDNDDLREGLSTLLDGSEGFRCVGKYASAEAALDGIPAAMPSVVLMDLNLPKMNGIECVRRLKQRCPTMHFMVITVHEDSDMVFEALKAGATGYLVKRTAPAKVLESIEDLICGGSPMSAQIARLVVESFQKKGATPSGIEDLTKREGEILALLAKGYRYKEIADALFISTETVRGHLRHVYEKLHVRSRSEAILKFIGR